MEAFRISAWRIDPQLNTVSRNGSVVRLEPKVMEVLVCLAEHAGEPVLRDKLLQTVWPATFVTDDVLTRSISELRRLFEDNARESHIIQTIPKRGYRLVAQVESLDLRPATLPALEATRINDVGSRGFKILLSSVLVLSIGLVAVRAYKPKAEGQSDPPQIRSLAVLPLQNLSADPAQEYFSEGMTDGLITDLAQNSSLKVISRTSSMQYKQTKKSLPQIAQELGVDGIVEGTVQRSGNRVRISAQLIHGPSDKHVWANTFERDISDMFALQRDVTADIAREVQGRVMNPNRVVAPPRLVSPEVLDAYLKGKYHRHRFSRGSGDEELRIAIDYFRQALAGDPNFALAYVGISEAHDSSIRSSGDDEQIAREAAETAVKLDPSLSEAWAALADVKVNSWDWAGAEDAYRHAIILNPNDAGVHDSLGTLLDATGQMDLGLTECQIAQQLDPNHEHLAYALYKRHQYDRAIQLVMTMLGNDTDNGYLHHQLYELYSAKGMYKEAIEQLERTAMLFGFPKIAAKLRDGYVASGYRGALREYAKALEQLHAADQAFMPVNLAATYAALGNNDRAFYWLEQGYKLRGHNSVGVAFSEIMVYPGLDPLRRDPRLEDLVRRVGLAQLKPTLNSNAQHAALVQ